jgi:hypothetical protein
MKSTCTTVMTTALSIGLIHATPAFASHFEIFDESYMLLVYLNLGIIVFLGLYASINNLENERSVRPRKKHPQSKLDLKQSPKFVSNARLCNPCWPNN